MGSTSWWSATFINFVIVGTAQLSRRRVYGYAVVLRHLLPCDGAGVARVPRVDPLPAWPAPTAISRPGVQGFVHAKVNGTKQLLMVMTDNYPRPIMADDKVPPAVDDLPELP